MSEQQRVRSLEAALEAAKRNAREQEEKSKQLQSSVEQLQQDKAAALRCKHQISEELAKKSKMDDRIGTLNSEILELKGQLHAEQKKVRQSESDREVVASKQSENNHAWKNAEAEWERSEAKLTDELKERDAVIEDLRYSKGLVTSKMEDLERCVKGERKNFSSVSTRAQQLESDLLEKQRVCDELLSNQRELRDKIVRVEDYNAHQQAQINKLESKTLALSKELERSRAQWEHSSHDKDVVGKLTTQNQELHARLRVATEQRDEFSEANELLQQQRRELATSVKQAIDKEVLVRDETDFATSKLRKKLDETIARKGAIEEKLGSCVPQHQFDELAAKFSKLREELGSKNVVVDELKLCMSDVSGEKAQLQGQLQQVRKQLQQDATATATIRQESASLAINHEKLSKFCEQLELNCEQLRHECDRQQSELTDQSAESARIHEEVSNEFETRISALNSSWEVKYNNATEGAAAQMEQLNGAICALNEKLANVSSESAASIATLQSETLQAREDLRQVDEELSTTRLCCAQLKTSLLEAVQQKLELASTIKHQDAVLQVQVSRATEMAAVNLVLKQRGEAVESLRACLSKLEMEKETQRSDHFTALSQLRAKDEELKQLKIFHAQATDECCLLKEKAITDRAQFKKSLQLVVDELNAKGKESSAQKKQWSSTKASMEETIQVLTVERNQALTRKDEYKEKLEELKVIRAKEKEFRVNERVGARNEVRNWHFAFLMEKKFFNSLWDAVENRGLKINEMWGTSNIQEYRRAVEDANNGKFPTEEQVKLCARDNRASQISAEPIADRKDLNIDVPVAKKHRPDSQ